MKFGTAPESPTNMATLERSTSSPASSKFTRSMSGGCETSCAPGMPSAPDDYEGISGYEQFRDDLVLMYFPTLDSETGELVALHMTPMQIRKMQLVRTSAADCEWVRETLARVSKAFGSDVETTRDG